MTDLTPSDAQAAPQTPADLTPASTSVTPTQTPAAIPPELADLIAEIQRDPVGAARNWKDLRAEAAKRRVTEKAAEEAAALAEQKRLADEQKWQELADLRQKELDQYKPRAERLDAIETAMRDTVAKRIEALPEAYRSFVPDYDDPLKTMQWLDANAAKLNAPRPPAMDAGARGDQKPVTALSDEELQWAKATGMTEDQFREYKAKSKADVQRRAEMPKILQGN